MDMVLPFARRRRAALLALLIAGLLAAIAAMAAGPRLAGPAAAGAPAPAHDPIAREPIAHEPIAHGPIAHPAGRGAHLPGPYAALVTRVIDGDTVEARIAVWLGQEIIAKVRLRGIDAPEAAGACGSEQALALAARDRLEAIIGGRPVALASVGGDKYFGRVVADLIVDGRSAGETLLAEGLARPYGGGRRGSWCGLAAAVPANRAEFLHPSESRAAQASSARSPDRSRR